MWLIGKTMWLKKDTMGLEKSINVANLPVYFIAVNGANPGAFIYLYFLKENTKIAKSFYFVVSTFLEQAYLHVQGGRGASAGYTPK